jgi:Uncharacterized conserved protein
MDETRIDELRAKLNAAGVNYQILSNAQNLASAEDGAESGLGRLDEMAPTFILHSKMGFIAATVRGDRRLSYKKIKKHFGLSDISLTSKEEVEALTGAQVGFVCLINPGLKTIVDESLQERRTIYGGTGVPAHTLAIDPRALVELTGAEVFDFSEPKAPAGEVMA